MPWHWIRWTNSDTQRRRAVNRKISSKNEMIPSIMQLPNKRSEKLVRNKRWMRISIPHEDKHPNKRCKHESSCFWQSYAPNQETSPDRTNGACQNALKKSSSQRDNHSNGPWNLKMSELPLVRKRNELVKHKRTNINCLRRGKRKPNVHKSANIW